MSKAAIYASAASLIRPVGFLVSVPLVLYSVIEEKNIEKTAVSLLPLMTLFGWFLYCKQSTGNWFASMRTSEWNEMYTVYTWVTKVIPQHGLEALFFPIKWLPQHHLSPYFIIFFMGVTPLLLLGLSRKDRYGGLYSALYFISIATIGTLSSYPRFFSFLFPVWIYGSRTLLHHRRGYLLCLILVPVFFLVSLSLWSGFIRGTFIA
jgi:hypothetical protein